MGDAEPRGKPRSRPGPRNDPPVRLPARRPLPVYAFDPMSTRLSGRFLTVDVPFERDLNPGPSGGLVQVVDYDAAHDVWYRPVDLNDPAILAQGGLRPSESDPRTHRQVVYAVAMSVIERFERTSSNSRRLILMRSAPIQTSHTCKATPSEIDSPDGSGVGS